ncbi:DUF1835 domain-containing protein [Ohtaekwangia sp.]|uniref:DUF1835 domain-containing protein n=1 Tax=Ohtaekwangia sp. TaxID=2066019 RepID=UPI002F955D86
MVYHILNGDSLAMTFPEAGLAGEIVVMREGLVTGDLRGDDLTTFFKNRAAYLQTSHEDYNAKVVSQLKKLITAPESSTFNLWFGYDLFCQVNMWFIISLLYDLSIKKDVYVVYPTFLPDEKIWDEYGMATGPDLIKSYNGRVRFNDNDFKLGEALWNAYKTNNLHQLESLCRIKSACFPHATETCQAHFDRFAAAGEKSMLTNIIEEIIHSGSDDFNKAFREFQKQKGVYGFGDVQFKELYDSVVRGN